MADRMYSDFTAKMEEDGTPSPSAEWAESAELPVAQQESVEPSTLQLESMSSSAVREDSPILSDFKINLLKEAIGWPTSVNEESRDSSAVMQSSLLAPIPEENVTHYTHGRGPNSFLTMEEDQDDWVVQHFAPRHQEFEQILRESFKLKNGHEPNEIELTAAKADVYNKFRRGVDLAFKSSFPPVPQNLILGSNDLDYLKRSTLAIRPNPKPGLTVANMNTSTSSSGNSLKRATNQAVAGPSKSRKSEKDQSASGSNSSRNANMDLSAATLNSRNPNIDQSASNFSNAHNAIMDLSALNIDNTLIPYIRQSASSSSSSRIPHMNPSVLESIFTPEDVALASDIYHEVTRKNMNPYGPNLSGSTPTHVLPSSANVDSFFHENVDWSNVDWSSDKGKGVDRNIEQSGQSSNLASSNYGGVTNDNMNHYGANLSNSASSNVFSSAANTNNLLFDNVDWSSEKGKGRDPHDVASGQSSNSGRHQAAAVGGTMSESHAATGFMDDTPADDHFANWAEYLVPSTTGFESTFARAPENSTVGNLDSSAPGNVDAIPMLGNTDWMNTNLIVDEWVLPGLEKLYEHPRVAGEDRICIGHITVNSSSSDEILNALQKRYPAIAGICADTFASLANTIPFYEMAMREQRRTIADFESGNLSLAQLAAFLTINLTYTSRHLENFLENVSDFISGFAAVEKTYEEDVDNVELLWELMRFEEATKWQIAAVKLNRRCGAMLHDYNEEAIDEYMAQTGRTDDQGWYSVQGKEFCMESHLEEVRFLLANSEYLYGGRRVVEELDRIEVGLILNGTNTDWVHDYTKPNLGA